MFVSKFNIFVFWAKNIIFRYWAVKRYRVLLQNQNFSEKKLANLNWEKRKAIVNHAYTQTAFYKEYYDFVGFKPEMLKNEYDWDLVPILEKKMIRENIDKIIDFDVDNSFLKISTTGGSTGIPLKVFHDIRFPTEIIAWRFLKWWNVSPADNIGILHRAVPITKIDKIKDILFWFPTKRIFLDASSVSELDIIKFIKGIEEKGVTKIIGYVGAIEKVADYILKNKIFISSIHHVWTTSAPLTKPVRIKLESAFKCRVMDQYGSCEVYHIANECPNCNGLHINSDVRHVDIVNKSNKIIYDETLGDILITDLENKGFPIIKYRNGDRSSLVSSKKQCNLPFPLLDFVKGRISDSIVTPNGIEVNGDFLTTIFDDYYDEVDRFRIIQKQDYSIVILVKLNNKYSIDEFFFNEIKTLIELKTNNEVNVKIQSVDEISDDMGKNRYIVSELNHKIQI